MLTPLDQALVDAQNAKADQGAYYTLFINSEILIPTWDKRPDAGVIVAGANESITPVIIEQPDGKYIRMFDTQERLMVWAQRDISYVGMKGYDVLQTFGAEMRWCLNVGTEHMKIFVPEELAWLAANILKGP